MPPRENSRPPWPAWYGLAALGLALIVTAIVSGALFALLSVGGAHIGANSSGANIVATLIQDAALAACAVWLAARIAPPRLSQFGVRPTPFGRAVLWTVIAFVLYLAFQIAYVAVINPHQKQTTLQDLGAGHGGAVAVLIGVLVVGVAPMVEEFFFRGFFYGALRTRYPFVVAALLDGVVFGAVHAPTGIEAVPPLIALGFAFCLLYEETGSILPGMVLHSLNNMVAFGSDKDGNWTVAALSTAAVFLIVVTLPRRSRTLT